MLNSELELRTVRSNACPSTEDIQDRSGAACHWSGAQGAASAGSA